jgi:predicted RNA-binding protein with RPS1 domain
MGQMLEVKVISIDEDNKVRVSRKALEEGPASTPESDREKDGYPRRKQYQSDDRRPANKRRY